MWNPAEEKSVTRTDDKYDTDRSEKPEYFSRSDAYFTAG
jgi:hypothetical protein